MRPVLRLAGLAVSVALGAFALRRVVFMVASLVPARRARAYGGGLSVSVIVPAHNEASVLSATLQSLDQMDHPDLNVVLVDDGSRDDTAAIMEDWCRAHPRWSVLTLPWRVGKAAALNAGIVTAPPADLIAVCDADVRVGPGCLRELSPAFADPRVGAASALLWPVNADESLITRYCAVELWQHQLITSAAKERLGLNPPALGWFACYRPAALEQIGGFVDDSLGEDVQATTALVGAGWQTRFVPTAWVLGEVPTGLSGFGRQRVRWARGLHDSAPTELGGGLSAVDRLEAWLHAAGYADRMLVLGAGFLVVAGGLSGWVPAAYLGVTGAQALLALTRAGRLGSAPRFLAALAVMFGADVATAVTGSALQILRYRRTWHSPRRASRDSAAQCSHSDR